MNRYDRLRRLEGAGGRNKEDVELARQEIRRRAEHADRTRDPDTDPLFVILSGSEVFSARDGRPITTPHQVSTESLYWREVHQGGQGLIHDKKAEEFWTPEGELALSRTFADLSAPLGPGERWNPAYWGVTEDE
jgi:hypothetical protein